MAKQSVYLYVPACSQASRRIIEESSYSTTPSLSPGDVTPNCGLATTKTVITSESIKVLDKKLANEPKLERISSSKENTMAENQPSKGEGRPTNNAHSHELEPPKAQGHAKGIVFPHSSILWFLSTSYALSSDVYPKRDHHGSNRPYTRPTMNSTLKSEPRGLAMTLRILYYAPFSFERGARSLAATSPGSGGYFVDSRNAFIVAISSCSPEDDSKLDVWCSLFQLICYQTLSITPRLKLHIEVERA